MSTDRPKRTTSLLITAALLLTGLCLGPITVRADEVTQITGPNDEWLPVGDMQPFELIEVSEEDLKGIPIIAAARKSNPRLRSYVSSAVPGGTRYGYDWISGANNYDWLSDEYGAAADVSAMLAGLYEALMTAADLAYASNAYYAPLQGGTYYTPGRIDVSGLSIPKTSEALVRLVSTTFLLDNPQYYMFSNGVSVSYSPGGLMQTLTLNISEEYVAYDVRTAIQSRVEQKYAEYQALVNDVSEDYDILRLVHDKMLAECDYSYIDDEPDGNAYAHNILGVMDNTTGDPVCESFSEAYAYILNRLGVGDAIIVFGVAYNLPHAWNLIKLDGDYYYVDSTWDNRDNTNPRSSDYDDGNRFNDLYYQYFLVGGGNADWGAGTIHIEDDPLNSNETGYLYGLPDVSIADCTQQSEYTYLTDNGYYGSWSQTIADNWPYCIGKSNILSGTIRDENPLRLNSAWNAGPYYAPNTTPAGTPTVRLYRWAYPFGPSGSAAPLAQNEDYTVVVESGRVGDTVRVWLYGKGAYRGIDFILVRLAAITESAAIYNYDISNASIIVEDGSTPYTVRTLTGDGVLLDDNINCLSSGARIYISGATDVNRIEVRTTRFAEIELQNVSINRNIDKDANKDDCAFYMIPGANVRLILDGDNTMKSGEHRAGIEVPAGTSGLASCASLEIRDTNHPENTASLTATSASHGAGIGGADGKGAGSVIIRSATVKAFSGGWGAGIGGGYAGAGGLFYMDGGDVEAGSDNNQINEIRGSGVGYGAGIGGGYGGVGGTVFVVSRTSDSYPLLTAYPKLIAYSSLNNEGEGAGIGGGSGANGGIVAINCHSRLVARSGGVEAYSSVNAVGRGAGIGGGFRGSGGTVVITDYKGSVVGADTGNALIKSSGISAYASAPGNGADIGAGFQNSDHGNQLILTQSATGDRVVGNVVLPAAILQYNIGQSDLPYAMLEYRIAAVDKLVVPAGSSLRVPVNVTLINDGEIENYGTIYDDWRLDNSAGKIINNAAVWTSGHSIMTLSPPNYIGAAPMLSTSAPAVPAPTNPALPSLPSVTYLQLPAANHSVWVDYTVSGTTATLQLNSSKTAQIISASADGTADIDLSGPDGVTEAAFPRQALIEFADKGLDVEFIMPRGSVLLSRAAARDIAGRGNNTQLYLRFRPANMPALSAVRLSALRDGDVVYELTMTVGGQNISSFNGEVAITVPYTGAQPAAAWYLDEKGKRKAAASSYANGSLRVTLHYFSLIAVGRTDAPAPGGNPPWYYVQ
jgi:hypothetical protein